MNFQLCDQLRDSNNVFYAFRIDGHFDVVTTRVMKPVPKGNGAEKLRPASRNFDSTSCGEPWWEYGRRRSLPRSAFPDTTSIFYRTIGKAATTFSTAGLQRSKSMAVR
jgi:hypothetical protein